MTGLNKLTRWGLALLIALATIPALALPVLAAICEDDSATVGINTTMNIDVLANDSPEPYLMTIDSVSDPPHGTATIATMPAGPVEDYYYIEYTPDTGYIGADSFTYTASDTGGSDTATVSIEVTGVDAHNDSSYTVENAAISIAVLNNDDGSGLSIDSVTQPSHGSATISGSHVVYTPDYYYHGSDSFSYTATDGYDTDTANVTVTVDPALSDGLYDDVVTVLSDQETCIDVLANDDAGWNVWDVSLDPSHGTAYVPESHDQLCYTPSTGYVGSDRLAYVGMDGALVDTAVVTITVTGSVPADAMNDTATTDEDVAVVVDVLANDLGDGLSIDSVTQPAHGSVTNNGSDVTYTPDAGYHGSDSFSYTISDSDSNTDTATVDVTINSLVVRDDYADVLANSASCIDVLANDDPGTTLFMIDERNTPNHGTAAIVGDQICYTPTVDYAGADDFGYLDYGLNPATVYVTVIGVPTANDDTETTAEDTAVVVDVLANDSDPDSDPLSIDSVTQPSHGSVTNNSTDVTYTPDTDYHGSDSFSYTISDTDNNTDTATVDVTVTSVNDPPVAVDDTTTAIEDVPYAIDVLGNDSDVDEDTLSVDSVTQPAHGSVTNNGPDVTYTSDDNYVGPDSFTYTASDGHGGTDTATVNVTVNATNDPPVALDDAETTAEDVAVVVDVLGNDSDVDGDTLLVDSVTQPAHGSVTNNSADVTYTPDADYHGSDSFTYTASDDHGGTDTATVNVTVTSVNDPPVAGDDTETTAEDVAVVVDVLGNDSDVDEDTLSVDSVTQPAHGSVTNNGSDVTYTPDADYHGPDSFTYTASDGHEGSDTATVTVTVTSVNDPPVAVDDDASTEYETAVVVDVLGNDSDVDEDTLSVDSVTQPAHGSVTNNGSDVTYTPDAGYHGSDSFSYTASDGHGGADIATVNVTVAMGQMPPDAVDDMVTVDEDTVNPLDVLANDTDPNGDPLNIIHVTQAAHGSVIDDGTVITYTPDADYHGSDSFIYTVIDGHGGTDTAEVDVHVSPTNDPPTGVDDERVIQEDRPHLFRDMMDNDYDIDGDYIFLVGVGPAEHGATALEEGGAIGYDPNLNYHGSDHFTYTISDEHGVTDVATVTIGITPVNDPLFALDDLATTEEDVPAVVIDVLANDYDADADPMTIDSIGLAAHGTMISNTIVVTYTPEQDYHGSDSFTYTVRCGPDVATATVTVTVTAVNDPPLAENDDAETNEETPVAIDVLANDVDIDGDTLSIAAVAPPDHGSVIDDGTIVTYTPALDYYGIDLFTYTVSDGALTDTTFVSVDVLPVNDPPVAVDDLVEATEGSSTTFHSLLANDSDVDGDALSLAAVGPAGHGQASIAEGDGVLYEAPLGFSGSDHFTYTVSDGIGGLDTGLVTVTVHPAPCVPLSSVEFSWGPSQPETGQVVTFSASSGPVSATQPISYAWSLGGMGSPIHHTFTTSGTHTVLLTATNACSSITTSHDVDVSGTSFVPAYGVDLTPAEATGSGDPGEAVTYNLWIINTGNVADSFNLALDGNAWPAMVNPTSINLQSSDMGIVTVTISVPPAALCGASDDVTLTASSYADPGTADTSTLSTAANTVRGADLYPPASALSGWPGEAVTHTLRLTNTGNCTDSFTVDLLGNHAWDAALSITATGDLAPASGIMVEVGVTIPPTATNGQADVVAVTVTSQGDDQVYAMGTLTTTVAAGPCVEVTGVALVTDTHPIKVGTPVRFTAHVTPTGAAFPYSYRYVVDSVPSSHLASDGPPVFTHTFETTGAHAVAIQVWNCEMIEGRAAEDTLQIVVSEQITETSPVPWGGIILDGPVEGVTGASYTFSAVVSPANVTRPITYTWSPEPVSGQGTSTATYRWTVTGTYTLTLWAENYSDVVSDTHVVVIASPRPTVIYLPLIARNVATGPETHDLDDAPDDCAGALPVVVGDYYRDNFDAENDNDWYSFEAMAGRTYTIQTSDLGERADTTIALYDGCETRLAESDDILWPDDLASRIEWTAERDGVYTVVVYGYDWRVYGEETGYTFRVTTGEAEPLNTRTRIEGVPSKPLPPVRPY